MKTTCRHVLRTALMGAAAAFAIPAAAEWVYDPVASTLTQGSVVLQNVVASGTKLSIGDNKSNATAVDLDFSTGVAGGYEIASIAASAFNGNKNVASLVLPDTLVSIGQSAFMSCSNIGGTLVLPDSLTAVGNHPFYGIGITRLELGSGLRRIGNWMFVNCSSLRSVKWNAAVTGVNEKGFYGCKVLSAFEGPGTENGFPTNLVTLGGQAFQTEGYGNGLAGLDVKLPLLATCGSDAFRASGLRSVEAGGALVSVPANFLRACTSVESAVFHEGTKNFGNGCFGWCTAITNVVFPSTVVKVGAVVGPNWGSRTMHVWWGGVPDAAQFDFASASGDNWSLLRGKTPTVHHVRWKDGEKWKAFAAAIPADYATDNALVLPAKPKPNAVGSWGLGGNQPVQWFDLPSGTFILIR